MRNGNVTIEQLMEHDLGFNMALPWIETSNNKPAIYWNGESIAYQDATHFELQLLVVFSAPPLTRPESIDWESKFFPGGLPSLGKRR